MDWLALLERPWWVYDPETVSIWGQLYRGFNLFEAGCWGLLAILVASRCRRHRHSGLELIYALLFVLFGLTDIREAWQQSALLVAVKGVILLLLLLTRRRVMRTCYPDATVY